MNDMLALLRRFCDPHSRRSYSAAPFSQGAYSYATMGSIVIRVARLRDVAEIKELLYVEKAFKGIEAAAFAALPPLRCPAGAVCAACDGTGGGCRWVAQTLKCVSCDGFGVSIRSVDIHGTPFNVGLIELIAALPRPRLERPARYANRLFFAFEGGDGAVMPVRVAQPTHYRLSDLIAQVAVSP